MRHATDLDRTRVYNTLLVLQTLGDGVLGNDRFTGTRMCGDEYTLVALNGVHGHLLEGIQNELIFSCGLGWRYML